MASYCERDWEYDIKRVSKQYPYQMYGQPKKDYRKLLKAIYNVQTDQEKELYRRVTVFFEEHGRWTMAEPWNRQTLGEFMSEEYGKLVIGFPVCEPFTDYDDDAERSYRYPKKELTEMMGDLINEVQALVRQRLNYR